MGGTCSRLKEIRVLIQGLDAAGKTTLLYRLKLGEIVTTIPTIGFNVETIESTGLAVTAWDLGGRDKIRPLYRHYYPGTDGFIYILDSSDVDRMEDAFEELNSMILKEADSTRDTVVMVLANKQDLKDALSPAEIEDRLITYIEKKGSSPLNLNHSLFVMPCSVTLEDDQPMWHTFNHFVKMIKMKQEGKLDNGFVYKAWEITQSEAEDKETTHEASAFHKLKTSIFKDPFSLLKSLLFY